MQGHQYEGMDLKPYLRNDVQRLDPDQVKQERSAKAAIFASVKEVRFYFVWFFYFNPSRDDCERIQNVWSLSGCFFAPI